MKEAKLRMEDALNATRAAVEEGVISGGGSAYIHASKEVKKLTETLIGDEKTGAEIILKALEAPLYHISANAGLEGSVIINKVRESEVGTGFDALNGEYVNMIDAGILDPAKVTRSALQKCYKCCIYTAYNRIRCCNNQRRCSGNAGRRCGRHGNDVIPAVKMHKNKYFLAGR